MAIAHANGYPTIYLDLKKDSLRVRVGDRVQAGAVLAIVGSSGCSTRPHLHFEVRDGNSRVVDPFAAELWSDPPSYEPPLGLLAYYVYAAINASKAICLSGADIRRRRSRRR